jgi:serine/threonine protein kinase
MICPSCAALNEEGAEVCFTCRAVLSALTQGSVIGGRYEILSPLGRGGMGVVYRAHDRVLDETVALKVLRGDVAAEPEMPRRFRSEIKLARRVAHPNVCRIYEYGEDGGRQYISMELVEGTNLKEVLRQRGALPPDEAYAVAIQVAEGLEAIHHVGIVHRDLKTLNVMIDAHGAAKVMDFGIAKKVAGEGASPSGSYVVGSPEYMSPEQARGQPVDFRSDVYALGIILFEVFTGRVPFRGDTPVATLLMHLETPPPLEGPAASAIPLAARPILRKALAKDPAARHGRAHELADALRGARAPVGSVEAARPSPSGGGSRTAGIAAAAVAVGAVVLFVVRSRAPASLPPPSIEPTAVVPPVSLGSEPPSELPPTPSPSATARPPVTTAPAAVRSAPAPVPAATASPAAPSPAPTPLPTPVASASPSPVAPSPPPTPPPEADGWLLVAVRPWADVTIDGRSLGMTPLRRQLLRPGPHTVVLSHPDYRPFQRKVTILSGKPYSLDVDLTQEGIPRAR